MSRTRLVPGKAGKYIHVEVPPPQPDPPPPPPPDPNWPYNPEASVIAWTLKRTIQHFQAIRAKGSTPTEGGPSFALADRSVEAFSAAAALAQAYWPAANTFELIGSDSHFPAARIVSDGLPENATLLRLALPVAAFTLKAPVPAPLPADYTAVARAPAFGPPPGPFPPGER